MTALGHFQTFPAPARMSGLGGNADIPGRMSGLGGKADVDFGPQDVRV